MKPSHTAALGAGTALVLALLQLAGPPARALLRYERDSIAGGETWRLLSGNLVHADAAHIGWNLVGLAIVVVLVGTELSPRRWLLVAFASALAVGAGLYLWSPTVEWYLGFSGVLHGLLLAGLLVQWQRLRSAATLAIGGLLIAKLTYEQFAGPLPFVASTGSDLPVVHAAHTYGAIGGLVAGSSFLLGLGRAAARNPRA